MDAQMHGCQNAQIKGVINPPQKSLVLQTPAKFITILLLLFKRNNSIAITFYYDGVCYCCLLLLSNFLFT
jgi:hypothetical protein